MLNYSTSVLKIYNTVKLLIIILMGYIDLFCVEKINTKEVWSSINELSMWLIINLLSNIFHCGTGFEFSFQTFLKGKNHEKQGLFIYSLSLAQWF